MFCLSRVTTFVHKIIFESKRMEKYYKDHDKPIPFTAECLNKINSTILKLTLTLKFEEWKFLVDFKFLSQFGEQSILNCLNCLKSLPYGLKSSHVNTNVWFTYFLTLSETNAQNPICVLSLLNNICPRPTIPLP